MTIDKPANQFRGSKRRKNMRVLLVLLGVSLSCAAMAQMPWIYARSQNHAWMLYRPQKLRINVVTDARIGQVTMKVEAVKLDDKECRLYSSKTELWPHAGGPDMQIDTSTQTWVDDKGKVLKIVSRYERGSTVAIATAVVKGDELEVTTENRDGKKIAILFPAGGVELFDQAFSPFMREEKKIGDTWEWYTLDPLKGVPIKNTAKVKNTFQGKFGDVVYDGRSFEITTPTGTMVAYVSKDGELMQIDYTNGVRIYPDYYVPTWRTLETPGVPPPQP
ncbi:MAG: hypothetical protein KF784_02110 [Fimbriimonadaceae bacterium]|nr:hypothetical protein [Fimbriimonadaceae bacterium]